MKHSRALSWTVVWCEKRCMAATTASTPFASATLNWLAYEQQSMHEHSKTRQRQISKCLLMGSMIKMLKPPFEDQAEPGQKLTAHRNQGQKAATATL